MSEQNEYETFYALYPDREVDMIALNGMNQGSGFGSINYGMIMAYLAEDIAGGTKWIGSQIVRLVEFMSDLVSDIPGVSDEWLEDLGRVEEAFGFGAGPQPWHPSIAPKGYVNRFEFATESIVLVTGIIVLRLIVGKIGIGGLGAAVGGMYGKMKAREWRDDLTEAIEGIDDLILESQDTTLRPRLEWNSEMIQSIASSLANNNKHEIRHVLNDLRNYENEVQLIGRE